MLTSKIGRRRSFCVSGLKDIGEVAGPHCLPSSRARSRHKTLVTEVIREPKQVPAGWQPGCIVSPRDRSWGPQMNDNDSPSQQDHKPENAPAFSLLKPGDTIADCSALWAASDRIVEELSRCHLCERPTFRVLTIASDSGLERRTALCGQHFVAAAKQFPQLNNGHSLA